MDEKYIECPQCHYTWYKYYEEEDPCTYAKELPVAVKTFLGYLCRLCRYEWRGDGSTISQNDIDRSVASFIKHGNESHVEIMAVENNQSLRKTAKSTQSTEGTK